MERKSKGLMLADGLLAEFGGKRTAKLLNQLEQTIPWLILVKQIKPIYRNNTSRGGRPNIPAITMLKITFMQRWFGLSDEQMEEAIDDRFSFRKFLNLSIQDQGVDHATIALFRKRLAEAGLVNTLFEVANAYLFKQGVMISDGTCVDATIIQAPTGRTTKDGLGNSKDKTASHTKKHGRIYHGYKAHIATDKNGMIKDFVFDTAKVHDSKHIDQLTQNEKFEIFADSAYMSKLRKERLEKENIYCGIIQRRVRGQKELTPEQKQHNKKVSKVRGIVEMPFAWLRKTRGYTTRYRGIQKNGLDFGLWVIAYNFRRSLSLMT